MLNRNVLITILLVFVLTSCLIFLQEKSFLYLNVPQALFAGLVKPHNNVHIKSIKQVKRLVYKKCAEHLPNATDKKIHLITSIIYYGDKKYENTLVYNSSGKPTKKQIEDRMNEIIYTLQVNLNHTQIGSIHLLLETKSAVDYISNLQLYNKEKLFIYENKAATLIDSLDFAFQCLPNRFVIFVNQDISFQEGWDKINISSIRDHNDGYVLTRHQSPRCPNIYGTCIPKNDGYGAHDAFAFYSRPTYNDVNKTLLKNVTPKHFGMENLLAWWLRNVLKLTILNPCKTLITFHEHCIPLRVTGRQRVNNQHSASIGFTDKLV